MEPVFSITHNRSVEVSFRFRNLIDSTFLSVETVQVKVGEAEPKEFRARQTISLRVNPDKEKHLLMSFMHNGKRYRKFISIPYPGEMPFDVSFFPEGGYLMDEVPCKVGFKALRSDGLSEEITGNIYSSDDECVTTIESHHAGMGSFIMVPESGKIYYALCINKDSVTLRFDLPAVQPHACVVRVVQRNEQFLIAVNDHRIHKDDLFLIVHVRGMLLFADQMPQNNMVALQATDLPPGLIQVLLLDRQMNPLSERLVFNRPHAFARAALIADQSDYGKREPVKVEIKLDLPDGYQNCGSFAISVTDDRHILPDSSMTIASYLLLSSELKGHIEGANYYLNDHPVAAEALDALLLTQGWRRYDIPAVAKGTQIESEGYIEVGQEFLGTVKEILTGRPAQKASVWMMVPGTEYLQEVKTDKLGLFHITGFEFPDSTRYVLHAHDARNRRVDLLLDPELPPMTSAPIVAQSKKSAHPFSAFLDNRTGQKFEEEPSVRTYDINEITVTAKKVEADRSVYSSEISGRTIPQEIIDIDPINIVSILKQQHDILIYENPMTRVFSVFIKPLRRLLPPDDKKAVPALIVLNDVPMEEGFMIDNLVSIPIKRIEILKPPASYIFGTKGDGGALLITTGIGEESAPKLTPHVRSVTPLGYKKASEFYAPKYEAQFNNPKPDLRTTIYWKPDVQLSDGTASVEFYAADANTTYSVVLEGITQDGVIIRHAGQISRKK